MSVMSDWADKKFDTICQDIGSPHPTTTDMTDVIRQVITDALREARADGLREAAEVLAELRKLRALSQWQWARIGACVRHARALLDADEYVAFVGRVDADPHGGMEADPRNPMGEDALDAEEPNPS